MLFIQVCNYKGTVCNFKSFSYVRYHIIVLMESIKTTSMENVSTGVLEKIKNNI